MRMQSRARRARNVAEHWRRMSNSSWSERSSRFRISGTEGSSCVPGEFRAGRGGNPGYPPGPREGTPVSSAERELRPAMVERSRAEARASKSTKMAADKQRQPGSMKQESLSSSIWHFCFFTHATKSRCATGSPKAKLRSGRSGWAPRVRG